MDHLKILILMWVGGFISCATGSSLEVTTFSGKIRGFTVKGNGEQSVNAFLGIPFGSSTDGRNRFSPPREVSPWNGVFNASRFSGPCYQVVDEQSKDQSWVSTRKETEDCLKLNIWVPSSGSKNKAVMVWIHGGAFTAGSSDLPRYDGATLAFHEDVIVVSLNYRLSVFGFLYLNHPLAPGNVGLMDQALGLKWIRQNIKAFSGDPERITIFGQSAGSACVSFHLIAPTSSDLFQNAILQSGSINAHWAAFQPEHSLSQSLKLAEHVGCPTDEDNREETIQCLQDLDGDELLKAAVKAVYGEMKLLFRPVIDGKYLPVPPSELLNQRKFTNKKNVLLGYTREDGSFLMVVDFSQFFKPDELSYTEDDLKQIIAKGTNAARDISGLSLELVKLMYSACGSENSSSANRIVQFLTDRYFACDLTIYADSFSSNGNSVYFYRFDHVPATKDQPVPSWFGSVHGEELPFIFGSALQQETEANVIDFRITKQLMRYWTNFAKNGDPNSPDLPFWPKYSIQDKRWLRIGGDAMKEEHIKRQKECTFWNEIYPEIEKQNLLKN